MVVPLEFNVHAEKFMAILPVITGFLSLLGSIWIIVEVLTTKAKRHTVYNRLLLGMSIVDVFVSIAFMFSTTPIPAGTEEVYWAYGNVHTCTAQGFFIQLGIVPPVYHVCLSVYYLLLVKFEFTQDTIASYAEPMMHGTALLLGFGTATASIALDLFNSRSLWCWIESDPLDCEESFMLPEGEETDCVRGDNAFIYSLAFFYVPLWLSMLIVLGVNIWIYRTVQRREQKVIEMHSAHHQKHGRPSYGNTLSMAAFKSISNEQQGRDEKRKASFVLGSHPSNSVRARERNAQNVGELKGEEDGPIVPSVSGKSKFESKMKLNQSIVQRTLTDSNRREGSEIDVSRDESPRLINEKRETDSDSMSDLKRNHSFGFVKNGDASKDDASYRFIPGALLGLFHRSANNNSSFFMKDDDVPIESTRKESQRSVQNPKTILPETLVQRISRISFYPWKHKEESEEKNERMDSVRSADVRYVVSTVEDFTSAARQYAATYHIGARLVLYQSIAYVLGFWMIWLLPTINKIVSHNTETNRYWLLFCTALFEPLQGFFNIFVYRFAHYVRLKQLHPKWSTWRLLRNTLRFTFMGPSKDVAADDTVIREHNERMNYSMPNSQMGSITAIREGDVGSDDDDGECTGSVYESTIGKSSEITPRPLKRVSSLMGDLMMEFTDDLSFSNGNFVETGREQGLPAFPYRMAPASGGIPPAYPSTFSRVSTTYPSPMPMADFPITESSAELRDSESSPGEKSENMTDLPSMAKAVNEGSDAIEDT